MKLMKDKRIHTRFVNEEEHIAYLDIGKSGDKFKPMHTGLVLNESYSGCALAILKRAKLEVGQNCTVKVGELNPLPGRIVWAKLIDDDLLKVGIQYDK